VPASSSTPGPGRLLADWTLTSIQANVDITAPTTGTATEGTGLITISPNSLNSTQVLATQRADVLWGKFFPGILAVDGSLDPDLAMTMTIDSDQDYSAELWVDLSVDSNMLTDPSVTENGIIIPFSESMIVAANNVKAGNARRGLNFPRRFAGIPAQASVAATFRSHFGWANGYYVQPPRLQLFGDLYDQAVMDFVNEQLGPWDPGTTARIRYNSVRRRLLDYAPFDGAFVLTGGKLTMQNFTAKPGGYQQVSPVQVFPLWRFSRPAVDVDTGIFALSRVVDVGGNPPNVSTREDLGFKYAGSANAVIINYFGRRPSPSAPSPSLSYGAGYFGVTFDAGKTVYPNVTPYGLPCTTLHNPVPYGAYQPTMDQIGYYRWRKWGSWAPGEAAPELFFNENAAFTVGAKQGATISGTGTADGAGVPRNYVDSTAFIGVRLRAGGPANA
jgi:hypothetical protein